MATTLVQWRQRPTSLTEPIINAGVRYKQEDFELLANMTTEPILLTVNASSPYKSWEDLVKGRRKRTRR